MRHSHTFRVYWGDRGQGLGGTVILRTTKHYSSKVLQSTTPVLFRAPVLLCASPYYQVLLHYYSVLQSSTPYYKPYSVLQGNTRDWSPLHMKSDNWTWPNHAMSFVYRKFLHLNFLRTFLLFASKLSRRVISEKNQCASYSSQFSASHPRHFPSLLVNKGGTLPLYSRYGAGRQAPKKPRFHQIQWHQIRLLVEARF